MATVEDFVFNLLSTTTAISSVVGSRIYRVKMPDNPQLPAITYQTLSGQTIESFDGYSGLRNPIIGIDCWANTAGVAQSLAEKVRVAMEGYSGTYSGLVVSKILEWSHLDLYDPDTEIFHVSCSCRVWYS